VQKYNNNLFLRSLYFKKLQNPFLNFCQKAFRMPENYVLPVPFYFEDDGTQRQQGHQLHQAILVFGQIDKSVSSMALLFF
jgi:hypothetical protein